MFDVLGKYANNVDLTKVVKTIHCASERNAREQYILDNLNNYKIRDIFVVDKNHPNGLELHCITESGLVVILNKRKYENNFSCHITTLIARPGQVRRYYPQGEAPKDILNTCFNNRLYAEEGEIF